MSPQPQYNIHPRYGVEVWVELPHIDRFHLRGARITHISANRQGLRVGGEANGSYYQYRVELDTYADRKGKQASKVQRVLRKYGPTLLRLYDQEKA